MKMPPIIPKKAALAALAGALLALAVLPGCKKAVHPAAPPPAKPAAGTNTTAGTGTNVVKEDPSISVFNDGLPPGNKGKDPFNPDSTVRNPAPLQVPKTVSATGPADPQLKLLGVVGSPGRWLATINTAILAVNEEATVRVPGGSVKLKVVEIGPGYADVIVEGSAVKRRLTMSQKD
jgi:hypothetical protein